eukprot:2137656-Karenia_brevis.AAC.1
MKFTAAFFEKITARPGAHVPKEQNLPERSSGTVTESPNAQDRPAQTLPRNKIRANAQNRP